MAKGTNNAIHALDSQEPFLSFHPAARAQATSDKWNMLTTSGDAFHLKLYGYMLVYGKHSIVVRFFSLFLSVQIHLNIFAFGGLCFTAVNRMKLKADTLQRQLRTFFSIKLKCVKQIPFAAHTHTTTRNIRNLRYFTFAHTWNQSETFHNEVNGICQAIKCFYNCNSCHIHRKYHFLLNTMLARTYFPDAFSQIVLFWSTSHVIIHFNLKRRHRANGLKSQEVDRVSI